MWWLFRQCKFLRQVWRYHDDPRGLALGVALGLLLGLVPKGNLTALLISLVFFSLRTHLAVGLLTATCVSLFAPWLDPLTHGIGNIFLSGPRLLPFWTRLHRLPLFPWLHLNNTVVLGSLVLGTASVWPVYRSVLWLVEYRERRREELAERARPRLALPAPTELPCEPSFDVLLPLPDVSQNMRGSATANEPRTRSPLRRAA